MKLDHAAVAKCLQDFDFHTLFREHLGWDNHKAHLDVLVGDSTFPLTAIAEKRGFVVFICPAIPDRPTRLKIDRRAADIAHEHLIIYTDQPNGSAGASPGSAPPSVPRRNAAVPPATVVPSSSSPSRAAKPSAKSPGHQVWQWVRRQPGKPLANRELHYSTAQSGEALIQRLSAIAVALDEEEDLTVVDVAGKARAAFDVEKVTKQFYERFTAEHAAFLKLIVGIAEPADLQWYTSLMLNRLMFVYFIQKQGFLDDDTDYLRNRMKRVQQSRGQDKFATFYRYFLLRLFQDGLGKSERNRELEQLLGKVPYLNGGFFEVHALEHKYQDIDIPDKAFEKLFDFFDQYHWHLDERPLRRDKEINPDVVGYIFEKYINQKQMGAYYTKEDITDYIGKNTIIPFLFDAAKKDVPAAFAPDSYLWRLLREDPDRYIYPAVRCGVIDAAGNAIPLPPEIAAGVTDIAQRVGWNKPASQPFALPTETWREHVARRTRCLELREELRAGEVHEINDLITYNLDIRQFAQDAIVTSEGADLVRAFHRAVSEVTVLDPTCGSGAFLFAALGILQPLYDACLDRMAAFVADARRPNAIGINYPKTLADFENTLAAIDKQPNHNYFVLKSILMHNLYGVDIMEEAVEICKLRLFLKLAAQVERFEDIEPLPDIDFNIRCGNTLVGYAKREDVSNSIAASAALGFADEELADIEAKANAIDLLYQRYTEQQTDGTVSLSAGLAANLKRAILEPLNALREKLDRFLAKDYNQGHDEKKFAAWRKSHQPFHWFVEFYRIMQDGGFDVIVGNPPYVSVTEVRKSYAIRGYQTAKCSDIYANIQERCLGLLTQGGRTGMIVPLSLGFSGDFQSLRTMLFQEYGRNWFSSFGRIPAALFNAEVRVRNTIHLGVKGSGADQNRQFTTVLHRWFEEFRPFLMSSISYVAFDPGSFNGLVAKINTQPLSDAIARLVKGSAARIGSALVPKRTEHNLYFKKVAYNWLNFCRELPPCYAANGSPIEHTKFGEIWFVDGDSRDIAFSFLNGKIMFAYWCMVGDDFDLTRWMFADFPFDFSILNRKERATVSSLCDRLEECMRLNVSFKLNAGKRVGNYNLARCRSVTNRLDTVFAAALGLSSVMEDIELLYVQLVKTDFDDANLSEEPPLELCAQHTGV